MLYRSKNPWHQPNWLLQPLQIPKSSGNLILHYKTPIFLRFRWHSYYGKLTTKMAKFLACTKIINSQTECTNKKLEGYLRFLSTTNRMIMLNFGTLGILFTILWFILLPNECPSLPTWDTMMEGAWTLKNSVLSIIYFGSKIFTLLFFVIYKMLKPLRKLCRSSSSQLITRGT